MPAIDVSTESLAGTAGSHKSGCKKNGSHQGCRKKFRVLELYAESGASDRRGSSCRLTDMTAFCTSGVTR